MPAIEANGFDSHLFETVHNSSPSANLKAMDLETMIKMWLPAAVKGFEQWQDMFASRGARQGLNRCLRGGHWRSRDLNGIKDRREGLMCPPSPPRHPPKEVNRDRRDGRTQNDEECLPNCRIPCREEK